MPVGQPVKRLQRFADTEVKRLAPVLFVRRPNRVDRFDLPVRPDTDNAIAVLVDSIEFTTRPCLDMRRRVPADLVIHEKIISRDLLPKVAVVQIQRVIEVRIGGRNQTVGVRGRIVNRIHHLATQLLRSVSGQTQTKALALIFAGEIHQPIASHRHPCRLAPKQR